MLFLFFSVFFIFFAGENVCADGLRGSLLADDRSLGILAGLIKVAYGELFFQAPFECELKQAFIM